MKRFLIILALTYISFLGEFLLFNSLDGWGRPHLLIILIVFLNLYLGIRYGLISAFIAGVFKDAFSSEVFGVYIFLFMASAFLATILRRNFYRPGSRLSRIVVTLGVVMFFLLGQMVLFSMNLYADLSGVIGHVFIPELTTTMLVATVVFTRLKYLADRVRL